MIVVIAMWQSTPVWAGCPGDVDADGQVDVTDLLALLGQWSTGGGADLDCDGVVGVTDLLELLAAWGPCPPQGLRIVFDGAVQGDCDRFTFARDVATVDRGGTAVPADAPRFDDPQLVCSFGDYTQHIGADSGRTMILGSGFHHDGTELMVFQQASELRVYTDPTDLAIYTTHDMSTGSDADSDLMQGAVPGKAYEVRSGCVGRMGIYLTGSVMVDDGGWEYRGIFFAYSAGGKGDGDWVILGEDTDDRVADGARRPFPAWAMNNVWPLDDLEEWCFMTDYRTESEGQYGGRGWAIRITRPDTTSTGVPHGMHLVFDRDGVQVKHTHGGGIVHDADGSSKAFIIWGDGHDQNHTQTRAIADRTGYLDDANWDAVVDWHGTAHLVTGEFGMQGIGPAPGPTPGSIIVGNDEASTGLMAFTLDVPPVFTTLFGSQWGWKPYPDRSIEFVNYWQTRHAPTGQYVGVMRPSENAEDPDDVYLLYSPDGHEWGICARVVPGSGISKVSAGIFGDNLYWSELKPTTQGLMSVPIPTTRMIAPLLVGEGIENVLDASGYTVNGGNTLQEATPAELATLPPVPCNGPVVRSRAVRGETATIGSLQLAPSIADAGFNLKFWYLQVPSERGVKYTLKLRDGATERYSMMLPPMIASGEWVPLMWGHELPVNGGTPFTPRLEIVTGVNGSQAQWDTYIALESFSDGVQPNGYPVAEATPAPPDETFDIDVPASGATTRTFYLAWQVPYDQQSSYGVYAASQPIGSLVAGDDAVELRMRADELTVDVRAGAVIETADVITNTRWVPQGIVAVAVVIAPTQTRLFAADHADGVWTVTATTAIDMPVTIRPGDRNGNAIVPMGWLGVEVVDGDAGDAAITARLQSLDWLD